MCYNGYARTSFDILRNGAEVLECATRARAQLSKTVTTVGTHILIRRSRRSDEIKTRQSLQCRRTRKGRPPKLDRKVEEDLIAENQRLRMEIDYLKKLSALVLAEERKNGKRR